MDLSRWKKHPFKVSTLELDPLNPRIPALVDAPSQRDIVAYLVEHEQVHDLAKSIADFGGLYPSESLIAVEEDGKKIVVEGNRRLAALKLLISPDLAPDSMKGKFRSLIHNLPAQAIEKAEVVVAPSRAAAAPLIVARHTGNVVKPWSPAQQAKYIRTLVREGQTIEDVAAQIQMPLGKIRDNLYIDTMIQLTRVVPVKPEVREAVDDKGFSTLERLIQSATGRKFLGIKFDSDGNAVGEYDPEEFKKVYARILTDIAEEKISTRKLNTTADMQNYLDGLGKDQPNKQKKATWTSNQLLSGKTDAAKAALKVAKPQKPTQTGQRPEPYLIPRSFRCGINQPRIKEIFGELRRLKLSEYPNACAVLGRIFIELMVGHYLEKTGKDKPLIEWAKKEKKPSDWSPTLRQMMRTVLNDTTIILKPMVRRTLDRMTNDDDSLISLEHIDQFVHNRYIAPTERDLRHLWTSVEPLLDLFMTELVALDAAKPKS